MELYRHLDPRFAGLIQKNARMDCLWTGGRWCEGPVWVPAGRYLLWSDIPNDRVLKWDWADGHVSTFAQPCRNRNGHSIDAQGRVIACEHQGRAVTRTEHDGSRTVLADSYRGQRLNSPNDVVIARDGAIWFTDPSYGIDSDYQGDAAPSEIGACNLYRIDPDGSVELMAGDMVQPNGLAFAQDESMLYVADSGRSHRPDCTPKIRAYPVAVNGCSLGEGRTLCECDQGVFDGFRVDTRGHIWTSAGDGVHCYAPDGTLLGKILTDEVVSNLCFGGPKRNRLFLCTATTLRSIYVNAQGLSPLA